MEFNMKILVKNAFVYVDCLREYNEVFRPYISEKISEKFESILCKLCENQDFQLKTRDLESFILSCVFYMLEVNGYFKTRRFTKSVYMGLTNLSRFTLNKWLKKLEQWEINSKDVEIVNLFLVEDVFKLAEYKKDKDPAYIDEYVRGFFANDRDGITSKSIEKDAIESADEDQTSLLDIIERYPETEEGYFGILAEAKSKLEELSVPIANQIILAKNDRDYNLWYYLPARPYMRMLYELIDFHRAIGLFQEARDFGIDLLMLTSRDDVGPREVLLPIAIILGDDVLIANLFDDFTGNYTTSMLYNRALYAYSKRSVEKEEYLTQAYNANKHVPKYITSLKPFEADIQELPEHYVPGSETEGIVYAYDAKEAWADVPGAIDYMRKYLKQYEQTHKISKSNKIIQFQPKK
jgi:hypothetical protein